jgi:hypothetical protein
MMQRQNLQMFWDGRRNAENENVMPAVRCLKLLQVGFRIVRKVNFRSLSNMFEDRFATNRRSQYEKTLSKRNLNR